MSGRRVERGATTTGKAPSKEESTRRVRNSRNSVQVDGRGRVRTRTRHETEAAGEDRQATEAAGDCGQEAEPQADLRMCSPPQMRKWLKRAAIPSIGASQTEGEEGEQLNTAPAGAARMEE